jgi:hypothetical protein
MTRSKKREMLTEIEETEAIMMVDITTTTEITTKTEEEEISHQLQEDNKSTKRSRLATMNRKTKMDNMDLVIEKAGTIIVKKVVVKMDTTKVIETTEKEKLSKYPMKNLVRN